MRQVDPRAINKAPVSVKGMEKRQKHRGEGERCDPGDTKGKAGWVRLVESEQEQPDGSCGLWLRVKMTLGDLAG